MDKRPQYIRKLIAIICLLASFPMGHSIGINPHQPSNVTWTVYNMKTGNIIYSTSMMTPPNSWFPDLLTDLCDFFEAKEIPSWGKPSPQDPPGCTTPSGRNNLRKQYFYVCPGHSRTPQKQRECGGPNQFFCQAWGCESTGWLNWQAPVKNDLIMVTRYGNYNSPGLGYCPGHGDCGPCYGPSRYLGKPKGRCNPLVIKFTDEGKKADWSMTKSWGLRIKLSGHDSGAIFAIQKYIESPPIFSINPNSVTALPNYPPKPTTRSKIVLTSLTPSLRVSKIAPASSTLNPKVIKKENEVIQPPQPQNPLLDVMDQAFLMLNNTQPNLTKECWLCYDIKPPYYEGIAFQGKYDISTDHTKCRWGQGGKSQLTLKSITGIGTCLGHVPDSHKHLCNQTDQINTTSYYVPPNNGWWACSTGLTPCVHGHVLTQINDYCILVHLMPRILYHDYDGFIDQWDKKPRWIKREPVTAITLTVLLGLGVVGAGTGVAALSTQHYQYNQLRAAIDQDIERIELSITKLQESLSSLAEITLQIKRGMDLIFQQQGGMCAALGEECCYYTDHSGVIKDSMAKVREGLEKRKRERAQSQSWYESWFTSSPWLTSLLSALAGPLILILILLMVGPCIINRLTAFIQHRMNAVRLMVLRQQYQHIPAEDRDTNQFSTQVSTQTAHQSMLRTQDPNIAETSFIWKLLSRTNRPSGSSPGSENS